MGEIKDSGQRMIFFTGANRDLSADKVRFDLLPIDVMMFVHDYLNSVDPCKKDSCVPSDFFLYMSIYEKKNDGEKKLGICSIIVLFCMNMLANEFLGQENAVYNSGNIFLCPFALERLAIHYTNGAKKYGVNNWRKGLPSSGYIRSMHRHFNKALQNEKVGRIIDEDHLSALVFNSLGLFSNVAVGNDFEQIDETKKEETKGAK